MHLFENWHWHGFSSHFPEVNNAVSTNCTLFLNLAYCDYDCILLQWLKETKTEVVLQPLRAAAASECTLYEEGTAKDVWKLFLRPSTQYESPRDLRNKKKILYSTEKTEDKIHLLWSVVLKSNFRIIWDWEMKSSSFPPTFES